MVAVCKGPVTIVQVVSRHFLAASARFSPRSVRVGFSVDESSLAQVSLEAFPFPLTTVITPMFLTLTYHQGLVHWAHLCDQFTSVHGLIPPQESNSNNKKIKKVKLSL